MEMEREHSFSKTLVVVILLVVALLGMSVFHEKKANVEKLDVKEYNNAPFTNNMVIGYLGIAKADENGQPLNGVTFKLKTFNNTYEYSSHRGDLLNQNSNDPNDGFYYIDDYDSNLTLTEVEEALTEKQKNYIHSVHTVNDLNSLFGNSYSCIGFGDDIKATEGSETVAEDNTTVLYDYPDCTVSMPTYFILEETKVPTGYTMKKVLIPGIINVNYEYVDLEDDETPDMDTPVEFTTINIRTMPNGYYMEYGEVNREELLDTDSDKVIRLWNRYGEHSEDYCVVEVLNQYYASLAPVDLSLSYPDLYRTCLTYLENEKGSVDLTVISSVNNKESITTEINQVLEYKVNVKNIGTADAIDNVVTAKIPDGFVYVDGSVSNNGSYSNGVITWQVDRIDEGEDVDLTFKAYAPKGINAYQSYESAASVENSAVEGNKRESNKTYVKLSLTNPYTYAPIGLIILILLFVGGVMVFGLKQSKEK